jgi:HPt (histidine-containing phosphotransfer) domain-containing protein
MNDFLVKPFKKRDLVPVIERWMSADEPEPVEELEESAELEENAELVESAEGGATGEAAAAASEEEEAAAAASAEEEAARPAIFDLEEAIQTFMGKEEVVRRVVDSYVEKVRDQFPDMEAALEEGDYPRLRSEAHSIKGGGLNLSINRMGYTAAALEEAAAEEETVQARSRLQELKREFERWIEYCRSELGWELPEAQEKRSGL